MIAEYCSASNTHKRELLESISKEELNTLKEGQILDLLHRILSVKKENDDCKELNAKIIKSLIGGSHGKFTRSVLAESLMNAPRRVIYSISDLDLLLSLNLLTPGEI